jgi:hypothetical protein
MIEDEGSSHSDTAVLATIIRESQFFYHQREDSLEDILSRLND